MSSDTLNVDTLTFRQKAIQRRKLRNEKKQNKNSQKKPKFSEDTKDPVEKFELKKYSVTGNSPLKVEHFYKFDNKRGSVSTYHNGAKASLFTFFDNDNLYISEQRCLLFNNELICDTSIDTVMDPLGNIIKRNDGPIKE